MDTIKCYPVFHCIYNIWHIDTGIIATTSYYSSSHTNEFTHTHTHAPLQSQQGDDTIAFLFTFVRSSNVVFMHALQWKYTRKKRNTFSNTFDKIMSWVTWRERIGRGKMFCKAKQKQKKHYNSRNYEENHRRNVLTIIWFFFALHIFFWLLCCYYLPHSFRYLA